MELFNFSRPTYYKWKRDGVLALKLIEENFTDEELVTYIKSQDENSNIQYFQKNIKDLLLDNAVYSAKEKYQKYLYGDIFDQANNYGAREILKDILKTIEYNEIFMDNAKDFLIERVKGYEAKWLSLKNPQKVKLLSSILKNRFSKIEVYAICKYSDEILEI